MQATTTLVRSGKPAGDVAAAGVRSLPPLPFNAGVVGAENGAAQHDECENVKPAPCALGIFSGAHGQQQGKWNRKIIGPALLQAEMTGIIAGELENPRPCDGRRCYDKYGERSFLRVQFF